jgi:protein-S-isoprenylcysteine O-methyltransferase Ste14
MTEAEVESPIPHPTLLPPRGMLVAFGLQVPLAILSWPWRPSIIQLVLGGILLIAGSILNLWASGSFTRHDVGICPFSRVPRLVADGPYHFSRNPMYLGMVFLVAGTSLLAACPWNLWTALAFAIWLHFRFILPEERFLAGLFGGAYATYVQGRGRWFIWF